MFCENNYCIYWEEGKCTLDEISLNFQGQCTECIYVDIPEDILEKGRQEQLAKYDNE